MTYLELCQSLRQEVGIAGTGPATVTSQTGEMQRVVDWVAGAYRELQNRRRNWNFLRADFSLTLSAATQEYSLATLSLTELASWETCDVRVYLTDTANEMHLTYYPWPDFKRMFLFSTSRTTTGRPTHFTIKPDKSIVFYPVPDDAYTVVGEYFKRAQVLAADADEPLLPEQYHMLIVWQAIVSYAVYEAAPEVYAGAKEKIRLYLPQLESDSTPTITMAGALA